LDKLEKLERLEIYSNPINGSITSLYAYKEYIKILYELEWCDYFIIIAIINERFIDLYKLYLK